MRISYITVTALLISIALLTGCTSNEVQQNNSTESAEVTETAAAKPAVRQLSEDKLFSLEIDQTSNYYETYDWRIIGSMEAVDTLSEEIDAPVAEFYEWCSKIDFTNETVFVDFSYPKISLCNAYIKNGMPTFETTLKEYSPYSEKITLIAAALPKNETETLLFESRYDYKNYESNVYVFGSPEALDYCRSKFGVYDMYTPGEYILHGSYGGNIAEWGRNVDFEKYAVALKVEYFGSSSYVETLKDGVYVERDHIVFDYEVTCPSVMTCDLQYVFCVGLVPKDQLDFLEINDPFGIQLEAEIQLPHMVKILFTQYGGSDIGNMSVKDGYTIDKFERGTGWVRCAECPSQGSEYTVLAEYGYTDYYQGFDILQPGKYRLGKTVINSRGENDSEEITYYANFTVTQKDYDYYSEKQAEVQY